jgi:hypothetical protein
MAEWLTIKSLDDAEIDRLEDDIRRVLAEKKSLGLLTDRDVEEMIEMRLRPLPDIQDVQSVYENFLFGPKKGT